MNKVTVTSNEAIVHMCHPEETSRGIAIDLCFKPGGQLNVENPVQLEINGKTRNAFPVPLTKNLLINRNAVPAGATTLYVLADDTKYTETTLH